MRKRVVIVLLYIAAFFASIGPALIYFLINHDRYIMTVPARVKVSLGMVILAVIIILKLIGRLNISSNIAVFGIVFVLAYLLESLLNDILVFSFLALIGEIADVIIMMFVKRMKNDLLLQRSADANAQATANEIEKVFERLSGRT